MSDAKRGRPPNVVMTPQRILEAEVRESAKLNKEIRELVSAQLKLVQQALAPGAKLTERLAAIEVLAGLSKTLTEGMDRTAKHVLGETERGEGGGGSTEKSVDELLAEIRGKR